MVKYAIHPAPSTTTRAVADTVILVKALLKQWFALRLVPTVVAAKIMHITVKLLLHLCYTVRNYFLFPANNPYGRVFRRSRDKKQSAVNV